MLREDFEKLPIACHVFGSGFLQFDHFEEWKTDSLVITYENEKKRWIGEGKVLNEQLLFHGCPTKEGKEGIRTRGFDISKLGNNTKNKGINGAGIYFSTTPGYAGIYSRPLSQCSDSVTDLEIIVSKVLVGRSFQIQNEIIENNKKVDTRNLLSFLTYPALPYLGAGLRQGYDTHINSLEVVVFDAKQILPLGLLHLKVVVKPERNLSGMTIRERKPTKKAERLLTDIRSIQESIFSVFRTPRRQVSIQKVKILKCVLLVKLSDHLNRNLIFETFSFFC